MLVKPAQASMGVHFLLSKSLAPTYWRLVKVNLTIAAYTKNCNTAATKNKEKEGRKCQTRWAPSGPSLRFTKLGELHMGPSVYLVTNCLFVCYSWTRRAPSGPSSSHVKLGELHKGPSSVLSKFVELVFLLVSNVRSGLILDKLIYNNFCVGTSMRNSTT